MDEFLLSHFYVPGTCNIGSYSESGVEPCKPCPRGTFQSLRGQTKCNDCPHLQSTQGVGTTNQTSCRGIMIKLYWIYSEIVINIAVNIKKDLRNFEYNLS